MSKKPAIPTDRPAKELSFEESLGKLHVGGKENRRKVIDGMLARYGYVGPLLSTFYPTVEDYFPVPHYWDGQVRVGWRLGSGETVDVTMGPTVAPPTRAELLTPAPSSTFQFLPVWSEWPAWPWDEWQPLP